MKKGGTPQLTGTTYAFWDWGKVAEEEREPVAGDKSWGEQNRIGKERLMKEESAITQGLRRLDVQEQELLRERNQELELVLGEGK